MRAVEWRRSLKQTSRSRPVSPMLPTPQLPLCAVSDRGRAAAQYVAKGRLRKSFCSFKDTGSEVIFNRCRLDVPYSRKIEGSAFGRQAQLVDFGLRVRNFFAPWTMRLSALL